MSKWSDPSEELDKRVKRALIVQEYHPGDVSALDYLAHKSRTDPLHIDETQQ